MERWRQRELFLSSLCCFTPERSHDTVADVRRAAGALRRSPCKPAGVLLAQDVAQLIERFGSNGKWVFLFPAVFKSVKKQNLTTLTFTQLHQWVVFEHLHKVTLDFSCKIQLTFALSGLSTRGQ